MLSGSATVEIEIEFEQLDVDDGDIDGEVAAIIDAVLSRDYRLIVLGNPDVNVHDWQDDDAEEDDDD